MGFELDGKRRRRLREEIKASFVGSGEFSLFVSDYLTLEFDLMVSNAEFEIQLHQFILKIEKRGDLDRLCVALVESRPRKANLLAIASEILQAMKPGLGPQTKRALMIGERPFLNRNGLRLKLESFVSGNGLKRILVVFGDEATGKSYSAHLISHDAGSLKFVYARLPRISGGEFEASHIAIAICDRLWPDAPLFRFDDLGQEARDAKWYGDRLVGRLEKLDSETLLFLDGFNAAPLSEAATELLVRLCRAIETSECTNLWLALVGLRVEQLGSEYDAVVQPDLASAPQKSDIAEFLTEVSAQFGKLVDPRTIDAAAAELASTLGDKPSHARWIEFNRLLPQKCNAIRMF